MCALLLFGTLACASAPHASQQQPSVAHFWAVSVADIEKVGDWYEEHLHFRTVKVASLPNGSQTRVLQNGPEVVELVKVSAAKPLKELVPTMERRLLLHGVFKVGISVTDLDDVVRRMRGAGVTFRGEIVTDTDLRTRTILAVDPEGNIVQLFAPLEAKIE